MYIIFWRKLEWKMFAIWNIVRLFGVFYGHLCYTHFGTLYLGKSDNTGSLIATLEEAYFRIGRSFFS
jgi:hypothetical protein